jgi:hypothetical protein
MDGFKVGVVGSRNFDNYCVMESFLERIRLKHGISVIISGGARGADSLAERYAKKYEIPTEIFLPDWNTYGKSAGMRRNSDIVNASDMIVAFWDMVSTGTKNTINKATKAGKETWVVEPDGTYWKES